MNQSFLSGGFGLFTSLIFSAALPSLAATYHVTVNDSGFAPTSLTIEAGDTVVWENVDESDFPHTTTSDLQLFDPNYWNGLLAGLGDTFSYTFNNGGIFTYSDQLGAGTGLITVNQPSGPSAITLESPRLIAGEFLFEATGLTGGKTYVLSGSTNLTSWGSIATNVAASTSTTFTNATALPHQCFRLIELP